MVQALPLIFCLICPTLPDIMGIGYVQPQAAFCFLRLKGGGGVQAFQFRKHDFDLWIGGGGLDMYQQIYGGFGSMRAILSI